MASTFTVEDIYGERKAEFLTKVQVMIQSKVIPVGVGIQQFGFIGAARVPDVIATSITAMARAIQEAERARNELATMQAKAAKKIAEAEGDAQSAINRAKGEAELNRIRLASLTPQMLELGKLENQRALIEKWNGQLPTVESQGNGSGLLLQLPKQSEKGAPGTNSKCEEIGERHAGIKSGTEEARKRNRPEGRPVQTQETTERQRERPKEVEIKREGAIALQRCAL